MAYTIWVEDEPPLIAAAFTGTVAGEEVIEAVIELRTHPRWSPAMPQLWDGRGIGRIALSPSDMHALVQSAGELTQRPAGRQALLTTSGLHRTMGLLYKYTMRAGGLEVEIFDDEAAARRWIGEGMVRDRVRNPAASESLR